MKRNDMLFKRLEKIKRRMAHVPSCPGIYQWLDKKGTVLYVGKAKNLRNRLRSYITSSSKKTASPWKNALMDHIADFSITVATSELEALILEIQRIKELKPKFNIVMKDDKNYVYLRISTQDAYPSIAIVRRMERDNATYFGPFLQKKQLEETLTLLNRLFRFRACRESITTQNAGKSTLKKECLACQIHECNGLCSGNISQENYQKRIQEVVRFFRGNTKPAIEKLTELMHEAASGKHYEKAATIRDTIERIQIDHQQIVSNTSHADTDSIAIAQSGERVLAVILHERDGKIVNDETVSLQGMGNTQAEILAQFIPQYYEAKQHIPKTIFLQEELPEHALLEILLKKTTITTPKRGKKAHLLKLAERNAEEQLTQQLAKWEAAAKQNQSALEELQTLLGLPTLPQRIEGYDISHLSGTETVGSMVVIQDGKPKNDHYRSFTIRTMKKGEIDDCKALKEVLRRRLRYVHQKKIVWKKEGTLLKKRQKNGKYMLAIDPKLEQYYADMGFRHALHTPAAFEESIKKLVKKERRTVPFLVMIFDAKKHRSDPSLSSLPDLIVIDGGKGQLNAARDMIKKQHITNNVISLAKREEEVFIPNKKHPVIFPKDSPAKFLLMRLRDEAHRFANQHRKKRLQRHWKASFEHLK